MTQVLEQIDKYNSAFEAFVSQTADKEPDWLPRIRREAFERFRELGFPTIKDEEWRHTNLSSLIEQDFLLGDSKDHKVVQSDLDDFLIDQLDAYQLVFVNGRFDAGLSQLDGLPDGVCVQSLAVTLENEPDRLEPYLARKGSFEDNPFAALNTAFLQDGVYIHIPNGTVVERPIHFIYYSSVSGKNTVSYPRNVIAAGKSSQVKLIESYAGKDGEKYFTNAVTEIAVGANASVEHCKLQNESINAYHVGVSHIHQDRDSQYQNHSMAFGGALVRNDIRAVLDSEGIHCGLNGLYLADGERHIDNHTWIDHTKPNCTSEEVYKGILTDKSSGVFKGLVHVFPDAQKTDAKQNNDTLLLSEDAQVNSLPQLEIYADDVKCSHGATTGHLDKESIFYLQARGINKEAAQSILTYAFACEVVSRISIEALREKLDCLLRDKLSMK
jgi:Fe-S cluster assembly protein SufD